MWFADDTYVTQHNKLETPFDVILCNHVGVGHADEATISVPVTSPACLEFTEFFSPLF